jgi:hypothetical protein
MAEPNIPAMKPNEKLLNTVNALNKAILEKVEFREEAPIAKDHKATSSNKKVKKLNK